MEGKQQGVEPAHRFRGRRRPGNE